MNLPAFGKKFLNSTIGTGSDKPLDEVVSDEIAALQSHIDGISNIKSVQRGVVNTGTSTTITISDVDPSKCHVTLHNQYLGVGVNGNLTTPEYFIAVGAYVVSLTATLLTITSNYYTTHGDIIYGNVSWEVTEHV